MKQLLALVFVASLIIAVVCGQASAETTLKPGEYVQGDADWVQASGGNMKNVPGRASFYNGSNLTLMTTLTKAGTYKWLILAWGDIAVEPGGESWPIMTLSIDGAEVSRWRVGKNKQVFVSAPIKLKPGSYQATIAFINDYYNAETKADTNLYVQGFAYALVADAKGVPGLTLDGKPASEYGPAVEAISAPANVPESKPTGAPGFYPPVKKLTYKPRVVPVDQLSVLLRNGTSIKIADFTRTESLEGLWKFSGLINSNEPFDFDSMPVDFAKPGFDDSPWGQIKVPANWFDWSPQSRQQASPYVSGWYRRSLDVPASEKGKSVILHFGVIGYQARLYVNGDFAGSHHGDFTPWNLDVTRFVRFGQPNSLAIHVLSDCGPIKPVTHVYGSQWSIDNYKGGIWQNAYMRYVPSVYVSRALVTPQLSKSSIRIDYVIVNATDSERKVDLVALVCPAVEKSRAQTTGETGSHLATLAPGENQGTIEVKLKNPKLWSLEDPYLYYAVLAISEGKRVVSSHSERFGFREFKAVGPNFFLNGKRIYLFGENLASVGYSGVVGDQAELKKQIAKTLLGFKERGYVIIRTPHMPILPLVLDVADEVGLMVFDEWGWAFSNTLDKDQFEKNNLQEVKEWVYRDYNHASAVMWSCGNEVYFGEHPLVYENLNKQVELVRKLDISGRPVSSFSGGAADYGREKLTTDVLDLHTYIGISEEWTRLEDKLKNVLKTDTATYGVGGKLQLPLIVWECVGYSWGGQSDSNFRPGDVDAYASYAARPTNWGQPNSIAWAGSLGLAAAVDPNRGTTYAMQTVGKRILEVIRYTDTFQGFAPWFLNPGLDAATLWNQPTYCGLRHRDGNGATIRNVFAGRSYSQELFIVNSRNQNWSNLQLRLILVDKSGQQREIGREAIGKLAAWEKLDRYIQVAFPKDTKPGEYQLRMVLSKGSAEVSRNFYDVFVQDAGIVTASIKQTRKAAILKPEDSLGSVLPGILSGLGVKADTLTDLANLSDYELLLIPAASAKHSLLEQPANRQTVMKWVSDGGLLVSLEQDYPGAAWFGQTTANIPNTLTDLVLPQHPVFEGLTQKQFDVWDGSDYGQSIRHALAPFNKNAIAARPPTLGSAGVYNAISEGSYGKGRILLSQPCATPLWNKDSAATTYLRNLLDYVLSGKPADTVRPWEASRDDEQLSVEQVTMIDLRQYVNMGFRDETAADQQGGWSDQGDNDFRAMPVGTLTSNGVPVSIIDPSANGGRSCIVLKGANRACFPESVTGIRVGAKLSRLYFLHATAWGNTNQTIGRYRINYQDASSIEIPLVDGSNIGDWYNPSQLPQAQPALVTRNAAGNNIGLWQYQWNNPNPELEIASIDFISKGDGAVPILVAVTGTKAS